MEINYVDFYGIEYEKETEQFHIIFKFNIVGEKQKASISYIIKDEKVNDLAFENLPEYYGWDEKNELIKKLENNRTFLFINLKEIVKSTSFLKEIADSNQKIKITDINKKENFFIIWFSVEGFGEDFHIIYLLEDKSFANLMWGTPSHDIVYINGVFDEEKLENSILSKSRIKFLF